MSITIRINGEERTVDADPATPLLWVVRDYLGMTGSKYGCGIMQCGACTMHIDGVAVRTCMYPVEQAADKEITTIEGLAAPDGTLHPLQQAWVRNNVPQCGYCQSGMLMAASALLEANPDASDAEIDEQMTNICRCGTYPRVKAAIKEVAAELKQG